MTSNETRDAVIEHDPHDHSREYTPLPGGWEVQTKGAGSSYRLLDKKTGERHTILSGEDWQGLQAFFTRFAHELFEACRPSSSPAGEAVRIKPLEWQPAAGDDADRRDVEAPSIVGFYDVLMVHSAYRAVVTLANKTAVIASGLGFEDAKAAAQADYEARILSALDTEAR